MTPLQKVAMMVINDELLKWKSDNKAMAVI